MEMGKPLAPYAGTMAIRSITEGPGRPLGPMAVRSTLATHSPAKVREVLRGLPTATGYTVSVKALRYRSRPHLLAFTSWYPPPIPTQLPHPLNPFPDLVT